MIYLQWQSQRTAQRKLFSSFLPSRVLKRRLRWAYSGGGHAPSSKLLGTRSFWIDSTITPDSRARVLAESERCSAALASLL